jgi:hypothetical protein
MAFGKRTSGAGTGTGTGTGAARGNPFKGAGKKTGSRGGLYLTPGSYVLEVQRCFFIENGFKGNSYVTELKVLKSTNEKLPLGSMPSYVVNMDKIPELALGNVADFTRACMASLLDVQEIERPDNLMELDADEVDDTIWESIKEANCLAGAIIAAEAFNVLTKAETDFTRINWSVPEDLQEYVGAAA